MQKIDLMKNFRSVKWTTEHTLTRDQLHQLIRDKTERAERLRSAQRASANRVRTLTQNV